MLGNSTISSELPQPANSGVLFAVDGLDVRAHASHVLSIQATPDPTSELFVFDHVILQNPLAEG